ncbi:threonine--tRNA ligase [Candidatus Parcubacteria bacterium]|nr:MAG: threonine--tRNA ligase [Candidatus Parcubacteria bacterium]
MDQIEEVLKENDHKRLGRELDLFTFSDTVGKGLPLWTPKGSTIRRIIERWVVDEEIKDGYAHVYTPDLAKLELYEKSGHYPYYQDSMYAPIEIDDEKYMLRPMTCPHHFELYLRHPHSYKELPIRYAELAKLYRYEQSGELMGLQRVRSFCLADAHIIARRDQAHAEINRVLDLIERLTAALGLKPYVDDDNKGDYYYRLSLGDRNNEKKYFKDDAAWDEAEQVLREVLTERSNAKKVRVDTRENEAAFYGPKIDIQMWNVNGKEDTAFTVQYDFVMPKRFKLTFINEQGEEEQPIVIHRSSVGAIERIIAFLIEKYGGKFPLWLAPIQVLVVPIADRHQEHAQKIAQQLREANMRIEVDVRAESMQAKIRSATLQKIPYIAIIGDKEMNASEPTVSVRKRDGSQESGVLLGTFISKIQSEIEAKIS